MCRFSKRLHLLINKTNNTKRWSILDQVYTLLIYVTYQDDEYFLVANIRLFCSKNMLSFNHLFVFLYCVLKILKNRKRASLSLRSFGVCVINLYAFCFFISKQYIILQNKQGYSHIETTEKVNWIDLRYAFYKIINIHLIKWPRMQI